MYTGSYDSAGMSVEVQYEMATATESTHSFSVPKDMDVPCWRKGGESLTTGNKHDRYAIA